MRRTDSTVLKTQVEVIDELAQNHRAASTIEVPWFLSNMPHAYFQQVDERSQQQHLRAIVALRSEGISVPEIMLSNQHARFGTEYTFIHQGAEDRVAARQITSLPKGGTLTRVLLFTSRDKRLSLNVFGVSSDGADAPDVSAVGAAPRPAGLRGDLPRFRGDASPKEAQALLQMREYEAKLDAGELSPSPGRPAPSPTKGMLDAKGMLDSGFAPRRVGLDCFLRRCSAAYVTTQLPRLLFRQRAMYDQVVGQDTAAVELEPAADGARDWSATDTWLEDGCTLLTLALPGVEPKAGLRRVLTLLQLHALQLHLAQVDTVDDPDGDEGYVTLLRVVVQPEGEPRGRREPLQPGEPRWEALLRDARRLKWVDQRALDLALEAGGRVSMVQAEVMLALADVSLAVLDHPLLSRDHVFERLSWDEEAPHARQLASLVLRRFDPAAPMAEAAYLAALDKVTGGAATTLRDNESLALLRAMASAARHVMRTNLYLAARWALVLRLDPAFFAPALPAPPPGLSNAPYGVFFCHGRSFNGYHVRFADIARGGLRLVLPSSHGTHQAESRRHFNECYRLAWAQHLKNKDIPEGGGKAVCLVYPCPGTQRAALLHQCMKKMGDSLLDLITPPAPAKLTPFGGGGGAPSPVVSRGGCERELLYLGPDENITPADINWLAARAAARGYAMPAAFISSKPDAGINHKEFGVTSEGVAVFLDEGLRAVGIDPRARPFSIKLTGGPDGDVGGNMLKILHREYGENVRVVGLADGSGCAEDPDGLPMGELLRLVAASRPIADIEPSALGPRGVLTRADTPAGVAARNSMHHRVVADAFVPAGGRPSTVNGANWRDFLQRPGGAPSARLVVEGANLFFDAAARAALFGACRLPMIKDSSANKCGVICSSMEIAACMVLSPAEFLALKPVYVAEVLARLRVLARQEAQMLFGEYARSDGASSLPVLSERISLAILRVGDALERSLGEPAAAERSRLFAFVKESLPPSLFAGEGTEARAQAALPWAYQRACVASGLASRLVYREGLTFVEGLGEAQLAEYALSYLHQEQRVRRLASQVAACGLGFGAEVAALLLRGGVRAATDAVGRDDSAGRDGGARKAKGHGADAPLAAPEERGHAAAAYPIQAD